MEIELSRVEYTVIGLTYSNCMKLLPSNGSSELQKVAVADGDGILQVFSIKKGNVQTHFKTLPGTKITSLQLGGAAGTSCDKIFVSSGNEVRGFTKKGKLFLSFESSMTEPITSMFVFGNELLLCSKHIYSHYRDCKEVGSYLCGDCIIDVIAVQKSHRLVSLIACEGRMIRTLEHGRVTMSIEVENAPTVLHIYKNQDANYVLFGTVDGRIGVLDIESQNAFDRWLINDHKSTASTISCICSSDVTGSGSNSLIIGRQDGNIEIYALNIQDTTDVPTSIFNYNCNESVTTLQYGAVGNPEYQEILVSTYTGRIFGLTSEPIDNTTIRNGANGNYISSMDSNSKIVKLRNEIEELKLKVIKEREHYQISTQSFNDDLSAIPPLEVKHTMILSNSDSSYILTLEVPTKIDNVLLQSSVPVHLLDLEKNSAVVSYSESDPKSGNFLLATYRCQINTNRLEIKIRTIEGQYGSFRAYVTPLIQPKCSRLIEYSIKPMSLHMRIYNFQEQRSYSALTLKGTFSLAEIHSWISQCFPDVPEKPQLSDNRSSLFFQSTFIGTVVVCNYNKGEAEFKSDNITSISILKDVLTKEATKKKIKIEMTISVNDNCVVSALTLISPKLRSLCKLSNKLALLKAMKELEVTEEDTLKHLSPKYKELIANEKEVQAEFDSSPSYLDRLYGMVTDLYVDYHKLKAVNVKAKVPKLLEVLERNNFEELLEFFNLPMHETASLLND